MGKALLIFLIPAVISLLGILIINGSKTPEVVHIPAAYGPGTGYQAQSEQYTVTASSSFKWHHGTAKGGLIALGIILFFLSGVYVYWVDQEVKGGSMVVIGILWLGGFFAIFGKHILRYYESNTFSKTISAEDYQQNKDNLDTIFLK